MNGIVGRALTTSLLALASSACAAPVVGCNDRRLIQIAAGSAIAAQGDSLTYGQDMSHTGSGLPINLAVQRRSVTPFPEHLQWLLQNRVTVTNRGFPGDRLQDGIERWRFSPPSNLLLLMYGGNDALNNGNREGGVVSVAKFRNELESYVRLKMSDGVAIVLLIPPAFRDSRINEKVQPYFAATCSVGKSLGVPVIDTRPAVAQVPDRWTDGIHLTAAGYRAVALQLASRFRVTS